MKHPCFFEMKKEKKEKSAKREERDAGKGASGSLGSLQSEPIFKDKKNIVRLVVFLLALLIAVGAFTLGITMFAQQKPGFQAVEAAYEENVGSYAAGVSFYYNFQGTSDEIKQQINALKKEYTPLLKTSYMLLDAKNTHDGMNNIASLNQNPGKDLELTEDLFAILCDADAKSQMKDGYSLYGGIFAAARGAAIYAEDPKNFDPLYADTLTDKIGELMEKEQAALHFDKEKRTARLEIGEELKAFLREYEIGDPVVDLDLLYDAYRLQMIAQALEKKGWKDGYLYTASGVSLCLSECSPISVRFCARLDGASYYALEVPAAGGCASSCMRTFALSDGDPGYYTAEKDGAVYLRHPYMTSFAENGAVDALLCMKKEGGAPDVCFEGLRLLMAKTKEEAAALAGGYTEVYYTLGAEEGKIYTSGGKTPKPIEGFTLETV